MEIADGCQLLEVLLLNVLYIPHALLLKELQHHNAYFGDQIAFLMEHHAYRRQLVLHILLKSVVEIQELMEHASMLPQLVLQVQELADYKYAQMLPLQQLQVSQLTPDVLDLQQPLLAQPQVLLVSHNQLVDHILYRLDAFKELTEYASGQLQRQLQQQLLQLLLQVFAD